MKQCRHCKSLLVVELGMQTYCTMCNRFSEDEVGVTHLDLDDPSFDWLMMRLPNGEWECIAKISKDSWGRDGSIISPSGRAS